MKAAFMDILRNEGSTLPFHHAEIEEFKYGWYPSGGRTLRASRDRVDFVGDAGSWTTPCGWGMGFILENYTDYAKGVAELVRRDRLRQKDLEGLVKLKEYQKTQFLLNKLATHFLSQGTASQLNKFISLFDEKSPHSVEPVICERMFTLRITPEDVRKVLWQAKKLFSLRELASIIPPTEWRGVITDVLRLVWESFELWVSRRVFNKGEPDRDFRVYGEKDPDSQVVRAWCWLEDILRAILRPITHLLQALFGIREPL
jgi:hypothetical protein